MMLLLSHQVSSLFQILFLVRVPSNTHCRVNLPERRHWVTINHNGGEQVKRDVTVLQGFTIFCQKHECEEPAIYLFRTSKEPIAYCKSHAKAEARSIGIELPPAGELPEND